MKLQPCRCAVRRLLCGALALALIGCSSQPPGGGGSGEAGAVDTGVPPLPRVDPGATVASLQISLVPVRHPELTGKGEAARRQIGEHRSVLESRLSDPGVTAGLLGDAFGLMGMLYHAYSLTAAAEDCYLNARSLRLAEHRWSYYLARLQASQGRLEEAFENYRRVLALRQDDLPALVWMARAFREQGEPGRARSLLERALELDRSSVAALFDLGQIAMAEGDFKTAVKRFEEALKLEPRAGVLHYALGVAYRELGQREKAQRHMAGSSPGKISPPDPLMTEMRSLGAGSQSIAALAFKVGRYELAVSQFRKVVEARPDDPEARVNLGLALSRLGRPGEARKAFSEALRLSPGHAEATFQLGVLHAKDGKYAEAADEFAAALRADPDHLAARFNLASMLSEMARHEEAAAHYAQVVEADVGNVEAHLLLGKSLALAGRYEDALDELERLHRAMPEEPGPATALARVLATCPQDSLRDGRRALALIEKATGRNKEDLDRMEALAMAHAETGNFREATRLQERALDEARRLDPDLLPVLERNLALYRRGEPCRVPW